MNKEKRTAIRIVTCLAACVFALTFFAAVLLSLTDFSSIESNPAPNTQTTAYASTNPGSYNNRISGNPGQNTIFDLTSYIDYVRNDRTPVKGAATYLNDSLREYSLLAGEVVQDVFITKDSCYFWDPMPSADVIGIFNTLSETAPNSTIEDRHVFKFYARIQGRTEAILRYAQPIDDTLVWYSIKFVFTVADNFMAHKEDSPVSLYNNRHLMSTVNTFKVSDLAVGNDPTIKAAGGTERLRIMAASISYPGAVDAMAYCSTDMGFNIDMTPKLGSSFMEGVEEIVLFLNNNQYKSFGIEFLIHSEAGWVGLAYAYINETFDSMVAQDTPTRVEQRTYQSQNNMAIRYSQNGYETSLDITRIVNDTNYTTLYDYGSENYFHRLSNKTNDGKSMNAISNGGVPVYFEPILQGTKIAKLYNENRYYFCSRHGTAARTSVNNQGGVHIHSGGAGYRCQWYGLSDSTGAHDHNLDLPTHAGVHMYSLATQACAAGHLKPQFTREGICWCGLSVFDLAFPVETTCDYVFYSDGANNCTYDTDIMSAFDTVSNYHTVPFYLSLAVETTGTVLYPKVNRYASMGLVGNNVQTITLNDLENSPTYTMFGSSLFPETSNRYAEIENVYAYDRGYISVSLQKNKRASKLTLTGLKDTFIDNPKYVVLTVANVDVTTGIKYRTLVSIAVTVSGKGSNPGTTNLQTSTNLNPVALTEQNTGALNGGTHTFDQQRGYNKVFNVADLAADPEGDILGFVPNGADIFYDDAFGSTQVEARKYMKVTQMAEEAQYPNYFKFYHSEKLYATVLLPVENLRLYIKVVDHNGGAVFVPITVTARNNRPDTITDKSLLEFKGTKNSSITIKVGKQFSNTIAADPDGDEVTLYSAGNPLIFNDGAGTDSNVGEYLRFTRVDDHTLTITLLQLRRRTTYYIKVKDEFNSLTDDGMNLVPIHIFCYNNDPLIANEVGTNDPKGGSRSYIGYRGMSKSFYARKDTVGSVATDPDNDEFSFARSGAILFDDNRGQNTAVANQNIKITRLSDYEIVLTAITVKAETTYYLKVEDVNAGIYMEWDEIGQTEYAVQTGIAYIPIKFTSNNKLPVFSDEVKRFNSEGSYLTLGTSSVSAPATKTLTLESAPSTPVVDTIYSTATDDDRYPNSGGITIGDTLGLEIINWTSDNSNYLSYELIDTFSMNYGSGQITVGKAIRFTAKKRTSGKVITLSVCDGLNKVTQNIVVAVSNSTVVMTSDFALYSEQRGVSLSYSAVGHFTDFDNDPFKIVEYSIFNPLYGEQAYISSTAGNGYISVILTPDGTLTITGIAKSSRHAGYNGFGDFALQVRIKDDGDKTTSGGYWTIIPIRVLNSAPIAKHTTLTYLSGQTVADFSPYDFAIEYDNVEMQFVVNTDYYADNIRFVGLDRTLLEPEYADVFFVNSLGQRITTPDETSRLRIMPYRRTNTSKTITLRIFDRSDIQTVQPQPQMTGQPVPGSTVEVTITLVVANTAPHYRDQITNPVGSSSANPILVSLALDDTRYPKSWQFSPYTYISDVDLQANMQGSSPEISETGGATNQIAGLDFLEFDTESTMQILNNANGYISVERVGSFYRFTALVRNTDNKNIQLRIRIKDSGGAYLTLFFTVNVMNSRPQGDETKVPGMTNGTAENPAHVLKVKPETGTSDPLTTKIWTVTDLVKDADGDSPEFLYDVVSVIDPSAYVEGTAQSAIPAANNGSIYVNASVYLSSSVDYIGKIVLQATAVKTTRALANDCVWIGVRANDRAAKEPQDSLRIWIKIRVVNSDIYQPESSKSHVLNNVADTFKVMVRARDASVRAMSTQKVMMASHGGDIYADNSVTRPLIILAIDPDEEDIYLRASALYASGYGTSVDPNFSIELYGDLNFSGWYFILTFTRLGKSSFHVSTFDDLTSTPATYTINFKKANADYVEIHKDIGFKYPSINVNYDETNINNLTVIDLYDVVIPKANVSTGAYLRFARNDAATSIPQNDTDWSTVTGQTLSVNKVSATMPAGSQRYLQVLGGRLGTKQDAKFQNGVVDNVLEAIVLRGMQRTVQPVELTLYINVFDGNQFYDFDENGSFDPNLDSVPIKIFVNVINSPIKDTSASVSDEGKYIEFRGLTSTTERAVVSTQALSGVRDSITLSLNDKDKLDGKLICWDSILLGCQAGVSGTDGVALGAAGEIDSYRPYNNNLVTDSFGNPIKDLDGVTNIGFNSFFDITNPFGTGDTSYFYIKAKRKTDILPSGFFPLYLMVYDDYDGSSKGIGNDGLPITSNDILKGTSNVTGIVSRAIICIRIYIENSAPVAINSQITRTTAAGNYGTWWLVDLFYDNDMQRASVDPERFWDINPHESVDRISNVSYTFVEADAGEYLSVTIGKFKLAPGETNPTYLEQFVQEVRYLVIKNPTIRNSEDSRTRSFIVTIEDSLGKSTSIKITVYIPNTNPTQRAMDRNISLSINQQVTFSLVGSHTYTESATSANKGTIIAATDAETPAENLIISELGMQGFTSFAVKYSEHLSFIRLSNNSFTVIPTKATQRGQVIPFEFTVDDGEMEFNTTVCTYNITILSSPPELIVDSTMTPLSDKAIEVRLGNLVTISFANYITDPDAGDTLKMASRPIGTGSAANITKFTNGLAVDPRFMGLSDYLINGSNVNYNSNIDITPSSAPQGINIEVKNGFSASEITGVLRVILYVVDSAFNAVKLELKIVIVNDKIVLRSDAVQTLSLDGAGAKKTISINDYIASEYGTPGDPDFANSNTQYSIRIKEYIGSSTREIARYTLSDGFDYLNARTDSTYFNYFDFPEFDGIVSGRYISFYSKRRTPNPVRIDVDIEKTIWRLNAAQTGAEKLERADSTLVLRFNITVANTRATVLQDNLPVIVDSASQVYLKVGNSISLPLYGSDNQVAYLMNDEDKDALVTNYLIDGYVENDTLSQDFKRCLNISVSSGSLVIKAVNKMYDIDKQNRKFTTRVVCLKVFDEGGLEAELLKIPVSIANSAPEIIKQRSEFTVLKDKVVTTVVDGETVPKVLLSSLIYDADFSSSNESFTITGTLAEAAKAGGLNLYNVNNDNDCIANIKASSDFKSFVITGMSNTRGATCKSIDFIVTDSHNESTTVLTFVITVGNTAPVAVETPAPVYNIQGGLTTRSRIIFLNEADHNNYYGKKAEQIQFVNLFTDVNGDTFRYGNYLTDIRIENPENPLIRIAVNGDVDEKGFIISTISGMRGTTRLWVTGYDSNPNNASLGTLSAVAEIIINVSEEPSSLTQQVITVSNKRKTQVTPNAVYGNDENGRDNATGYTFIPGTLKVVEQNTASTKSIRYQDIIDIEGDYVVGKREGAAMVNIDLIIGEDIYTLEVSVLVIKNYAPVLKSPRLHVNESDLKNDEEHESGYFRLKATDLVSDIDDFDEIYLVKMTSANNFIVEPVFDSKTNEVELLCKASGSVIISFEVEDSFKRHSFTLEYYNTDLPELGFFASIAADIVNNPAGYIISLVSVITALLIASAIISYIRHRRHMRAEIEAIMISELNTEEQLLRLVARANGYQDMALPVSGNTIDGLLSGGVEQALIGDDGEQLLIGGSEALLLGAGRVKYPKGEIFAKDLGYDEHTYYSHEQVETIVPADEIVRQVEKESENRVALNIAIEKKAKKDFEKAKYKAAKKLLKEKKAKNKKEVDEIDLEDSEMTEADFGKVEMESLAEVAATMTTFNAAAENSKPEEAKPEIKTSPSKNETKPFNLDEAFLQSDEEEDKPLEVKVKKKERAVKAESAPAETAMAEAAATEVQGTVPLETQTAIVETSAIEAQDTVPSAAQTAIVETSAIETQDTVSSAAQTAIVETSAIETQDTVSSAAQTAELEISAAEVQDAIPAESFAETQQEVSIETQEQQDKTEIEAAAAETSNNSTEAAETENPDLASGSSEV